MMVLRISNMLFFCLSMVVGLDAKMLRHPAMELLNRSLEQKAHVIIRLQVAQRRALEQMKEFEHVHEIAPSGVQVKEALDGILEPVKDFFSQIKTYAVLLKPLIEESLSGVADDDSLKHHQGRHRSIFEMFFDSPEADVFEYLHQHVTTPSSLCEFCREFVCFAEDLIDSRSELVVQKCDHLMQELKHKKKT